MTTVSLGRRLTLVIFGLAVLLTLAIALSVSFGAAAVPLWQRVLLGGVWSEAQQAILLALRLPRVLTAAALGGLLGVAGVAFQALLRNPLADPYVLGVSGGASLGVAFACFAGGIAVGVGSLLSLAYNGLAIGAASAHFQNSGLLLYLWTFVAGHGVLELFAIWCAGAAGFMLGLAVLRPGPYTRRDALVLNARIAMRLVGAAIVLLLVAGAIEGFLSTSDAPARVKVAVSVASALLLVAYLANGARHRDAAALAPPP